ncbi:MAG: hypothetical protein U9P90_03920 [Patescibacteria group bacterium]|nr:hypothetical protein [Patescibacteria group bacterium]
MDKKSKLYLCVALVTGVIFTLWLVVLPYTFFIIKKESGGEYLVSEETQGILSNIKETFESFGNKLENGATSTNKSIQKLKEKIEKDYAQ